MKIVTIIIMVIALKGFGMLGEQKEFLPINGNYSDKIKFEIDTFISISHGNGENDLPESNDSSLYFPPSAFDIDENANLYLLFLTKLYKYNSKGQLMISVNFDDVIVDFKYYKHKLYLYDGKQLLILNPIDFNQIGCIPVSSLNVKDYKIVNVSIFYDRYFFSS